MGRSCIRNEDSVRTVDRGIVGIDIGTITAAEDTIITWLGVKATFSDLAVNTAERESGEKVRRR